MNNPFGRHRPAFAHAAAQAGGGAAVASKSGKKGQSASDQEMEKKAQFWRWMTLIQIMSIFGFLFIALAIKIFSITYFQVEAPLLPGRYPIERIPDSEYISFAGDYINLVATYQFSNAESQFEAAKGFMAEEAKSLFDRELLGRELTAIRDTSRSQTLYLDDRSVQVYREAPGEVTVEVFGGGEKIVSGEKFDVGIAYLITMTVTDEETVNPYGIVISNVEKHML